MTPEGSPPPSSADNERDTVKRLEERLDRASEAAERLIAQATQTALRRPPPAGWQQSDHGDQEPRPESTAGVDLLLEAIGALRDRIPPDLQQRLIEAFRELLVALRALIDWYLERVERRTAPPSDVQDIPIL